MAVGAGVSQYHCPSGHRLAKVRTSAYVQHRPSLQRKSQPSARQVDGRHNPGIPLGMGSGLNHLKVIGSSKRGSTMLRASGMDGARVGTLRLDGDAEGPATGWWHAPSSHCLWWHTRRYHQRPCRFRQSRWRPTVLSGVAVGVKSLLEGRVDRATQPTCDHCRHVDGALSTHQQHVVQHSHDRTQSCGQYKTSIPPREEATLALLISTPRRDAHMCSQHADQITTHRMRNVNSTAH